MVDHLLGSHHVVVCRGVAESLQPHETRLADLSELVGARELTSRE